MKRKRFVVLLVCLLAVVVGAISCKSRVCGQCNGSGHCARCEGTGKFATYGYCDECHGTGKCPLCKGKGQIN